MTAQYDHYVRSEPIDPPLSNGVCWEAKAYVKEVGTEHTGDIFTPGPYVGKTEEEAKRKARSKVREWIDERKEATSW